MWPPPRVIVIHWFFFFLAVSTAERERMKTMRCLVCAKGLISVSDHSSESVRLHAGFYLFIIECIGVT